MNKVFYVVLMMAMLFFSQHSYAAAVRCNGTVSYLGIDSTGRVFVSVGTTPIHAICNVEIQGTFTIPPKSCGLAYAALLSARASFATVATYYNDATLTCATLPLQGDAPSAYFVSPTE
jgi:hypothetical protein